MDNVFSKNLSKPSLENPKDAISSIISGSKELYESAQREEHINFNSPQDLYGIPLLNDKLPDNYSSSFIQNFNNSTISKIGYEIQPFDPISAIHDFESADIVEKQTRLSFIGGKTPTDFNKNFGENQSKYYEKEMFQNVVSTVDDGNKESWFGVGLNFVSPPIIDNAEIQKYPELDERAKYFEKEFTFGPIFDCSAFSSQYFGFPDQKSLNDFLILSDNLVSTLDISPKFAPETANGESINRLASLGRMAFELNTLKGIGKNWEAKANEINYEQSAIPADSIRDPDTIERRTEKSKITTDGEIDEVCAEAKHTGIMNPPKKADAAKTSNESINSPESTSFCKSYGRKRAVQVKGTEREKEDPKQEEIPIVNLRKDLVNQVLVLSKSNLNFSKEPSLEALKAIRSRDEFNIAHGLEERDREEISL
ncbi:hypothetical protein BY996DRAFT_6561820 [Phakopsora pachyrhizi]|nr:hypothetical protein BY996DRAFT_6561820 [Phakopsora pachyrhizi]